MSARGCRCWCARAHHALLYDMGPAVRDGFDAGERAVVPTLHALGVRRLDRRDRQPWRQRPCRRLGRRCARAFPAATCARARGQRRRRATRPCMAGQSLAMGRRALPLPASAAAFPVPGQRGQLRAADRRRARRALLTGDIGEVVERDAAASRRPQRCAPTWCWSPHHGSGGSSDPGVRRRHRRPLRAGLRRATATASAIRAPEVVERWRAAGAGRARHRGRSGALRVRAWAHRRRHATSGNAARGTHPRLLGCRRAPVVRARPAGLSYRPDSTRPDGPED